MGIPAWSSEAEMRRLEEANALAGRTSGLYNPGGLPTPGQRYSQLGTDALTLNPNLPPGKDGGFSPAFAYLDGQAGPAANGDLSKQVMAPALAGVQRSAATNAQGLQDLGAIQALGHGQGPSAAEANARSAFQMQMGQQAAMAAGHGGIRGALAAGAPANAAGISAVGNQRSAELAQARSAYGSGLGQVSENQVNTTKAANATGALGLDLQKVGLNTRAAQAQQFTGRQTDWMNADRQAREAYARQLQQQYAIASQVGSGIVGGQQSLSNAKAVAKAGKEQGIVGAIGSGIGAIASILA